MCEFSPGGCLWTTHVLGTLCSENREIPKKFCDLHGTPHNKFASIHPPSSMT